VPLVFGRDLIKAKLEEQEESEGISKNVLVNVKAQIERMSELI